MLILTRREGESIMLTREGLEPIEVKVLRVDGAQVKLGIDAPETVNIARHELLSKSGENGLALNHPQCYKDPNY